MPDYGRFPEQTAAFLRWAAWIPILFPLALVQLLGEASGALYDRLGRNRFHYYHVWKGNKHACHKGGTRYCSVLPPAKKRTFAELADDY